MEQVADRAKTKRGRPKLETDWWLLQARRQEMKWGCFVNKWKMGGCKKWTFYQRRVHYVQYQYFFILHFTYLGVCTHPTHPPPAYGPVLWCAVGLQVGRAIQNIAQLQLHTTVYSSHVSGIVGIVCTFSFDIRSELFCHYCMALYIYHAVLGGQIYQISYDLSYDYRKIDLRQWLNMCWNFSQRIS